ASGFGVHGGGDAHHHFRAAFPGCFEPKLKVPGDRGFVVEVNAVEASLDLGSSDAQREVALGGQPNRTRTRRRLDDFTVGLNRDRNSVSRFEIDDQRLPFAKGWPRSRRVGADTKRRERALRTAEGGRSSEGRQEDQSGCVTNEHGTS